MKIILREDVKNLGAMGDVVTVADGYARNYLIPRKQAVEANTRNLKEFEHARKVIAERAVKVKKAFQSTAEVLSSLTVTIRARAGEEDKLFGSVTNMHIAEALASQGIDVDKKKIMLDEPIKRLGLYPVGVKLHSDVTATLKVQIVAEGPETVQ